MTQAAVSTGRDERALCGAAKRQGPGNCTQVAGWGTDHVGTGPCKLHGGSTAAHRRRAARLVLADTVAGLADELRPQVDGVHPFDVLLGAVEGAHLMRLVYERLVHQLAPQPSEADSAEPRDALYGADHLGDHRSHPLTGDLERWTRTAGDLSSKALAAGIDERRVRLAESQGRLVAEAVGGILADIEVELRRLVDAGELALEAFRHLVDELVPRFVAARLVAASGHASSIEPGAARG